MSVKDASEMTDSELEDEVIQISRRSPDGREMPAWLDRRLDEVLDEMQDRGIGWFSEPEEPDDE